MNSISFFGFLKKYLFILSLIFCVQIGFGQDYYHAFGGQYDFGIFETTYIDLGGFTQSTTQTPFTPGVFYKATLALSNNFAVSGYPFVGISGEFGSFGSFFNVGFQVPVVAEFYLGELDDSAFFIGGGLSFGALSSSGFGSGKIFGPHFGVGGQFYITGILVGIRVAYTHGINKTKSVSDLIVEDDSKRLFTLGAYYPLGT